MKLDLHIHTQKCKQGDSNKRIIEPKEFIDKMNENNVKICSITNHNKFDIKEYELIKELSEDLEIWPGIELDIDYNGVESHIIVICNPTKKYDFYNHFDNEENRNYDDFSLSFNEFTDKIKCFQNEDIIIIPHYMDKQKSISEQFKKDLNEKLASYLIILETGKLISMGILNSHNEISLMGSDVQDWENYSNENLPEMKLKIDSFSKFITLADDKNIFINELENNFDSYEIETHKGNIEIFNDINIIFGGKGSGKTCLLKKYIYNGFINKGKKIILHEGKNYQKCYEKIICEKFNKLHIDEDKSYLLERLYDNILNYSESHLDDFVKKYYEYRNDKTKSENRKKLKKIEVEYHETSDVDIKTLFSNTNDNFNKIYSVEKINNEFERSEEKTKCLDIQLKELKNDIIKETITEYKDSFVTKNIDIFIKNIKDSADKKTGGKSKPNNIGFSKLVNKRLNHLKNISKFKNTLKEMKYEKKYKIGPIPSKGDIYLNVKIDIQKIETKYSSGSPFDRNKITLNRDILKKLNNFQIDSFHDVNSYFDTVEKEKGGHEFIKDIIKKNHETVLNGEKYKPSEGEKSILSITAVLENFEYDCYLFDEIERGLGNAYISNYLIGAIKKLNNMGKTVVISTHNANIAISTMPRHCIYCSFPEREYYLGGNMYSNELVGNSTNCDKTTNWSHCAITHLEGNETMFLRRKNIYEI